MKKTGKRGQHINFEDLGASVDKLVAGMKRAAGLKTDIELATFYREGVASLGIERTYPSSVISSWKARKNVPFADLWLFVKLLEKDGKPISFDALMRASETSNGEVKK